MTNRISMDDYYDQPKPRPPALSKPQTRLFSSRATQRLNLDGEIRKLRKQGGLLIPAAVPTVAWHQPSTAAGFPVDRSAA